ncbi:hypothetical protein [Vulcanisaeta sp. EB80]|uniref:hypothetical protein n=1 Tax=Vulcanisaeta sp. EB80 TaxID=1650660 RepID=UPI001EE43781|nr:hypothetical protein [Vulcanisaeta sp. EB80]
MPRSRALLVMVVLALAIASVVVLVAGGVGASPSLIAYSRIGSLGGVGYYASQPVPGVPPGLLVRVFLINGSVVEPVDAFIDVYANAPNGIVHVAMGYSSILIVPFNDSNWQYVLGKWASLGIPFSDYETSMLIFITYVKGNESWIVPLLVPYNVGWAIGGTTQPTSPRYILVNAFINVNELRPNKVVPVKLNSTVTDPQVFGTYNGYTIYNCSLSGPQPPTYSSDSTMYQPTSDCIGINGSLPIAWATWSNGVIQNDQGLQFQLAIDFSGTMNWDAMATNYGNIGTSYSAPENWALAFENAVQLGSRVTQPGSVYWYYGGATWGIVNYEVYYVDTYSGNYYQVGTTTVSEVLYVPPYDTNVNPAFDYGNGTISMLYNGATALSQQYFGYPALNTSTVVDYAAFIYTSTGQEYLYQCKGPVNANTGVSGTYYTITLGGVETAYSLSTAEIGTELGGLAFDILVDAAAEAMTEGGATPLIEFLNQVGSAIFDIAGLLIPPQTSSSVTQTTLEISGVTTGTNLYISVIDATAVYGLPTFGFILNATNYYGNPTTYTCKYGKVTWIG